jgi:hypothetical protein
MTSDDGVTDGYSIGARMFGDCNDYAMLNRLDPMEFFADDNDQL